MILKVIKLSKMPLLDITDPGVIRFLAESYEKESHLRMRWVAKNSEDIAKCATFTGEVKDYTPDDITKAILVAGMPTIIRDHAVSMRHRLRAPVPEYMSIKTKQVTSSVPKMIQVKDEVKQTLLEGRKKYLKERMKDAPDAKYNFVESANWEYGWKLDESEIKMKGPMYGRVSYTMHNLQSRVGPQPDPTHYRASFNDTQPCFN